MSEGSEQGESLPHLKMERSPFGCRGELEKWQEVRLAQQGGGRSHIMCFLDSTLSVRENH